MIEAHIDDREIDKLIKNIKGWQTETRRRIIDELKVSGLVIEGDAKRRAPVDTGRLRSSIGRVVLNNGLTNVVRTRVKYAPFVEFGTGTGVSVPKGAEDYAMQFKGKGKMKINNRAQPFLFPAYEAERPKLIENLKRILKRK